MHKIGMMRRHLLKMGLLSAALFGALAPVAEHNLAGRRGARWRRWGHPERRAVLRDVALLGAILEHALAHSLCRAEVACGGRS